MDYHRLLDSLARVVRQITSRYDYAALYPCEVVGQNDDTTLELKPDTPDFGPGLSNVPLRLGVPGLSVKVKSGGRAYLGFEAFDPQRPYAIIFDANTLDTVEVTAQTKVTVHAPAIELMAGGLPVARQGDMITIPMGTPITGIFPAPGSGTMIVGPPGISGIISSGNPGVRS